MSKLIAYLRVSTAGQAQDGGSLDAQWSCVEAYCRAHGHTLVDVVVDAGASASTLDRPGVREVLARLRGGHARPPQTPAGYHGCVPASGGAGYADGIVFTKIDRLTRSVRDLCRLIEDEGAGRDYELHSVAEHIDTTTAMGEAMLNMVIVFSQLERKRIGERTSEVLQHKRSQGQSLGPVPYGYRRVSGRLEPIPGEQAVLAGLRARQAEGASLATLASELNAAGVEGRRAGGWHPTSVARALSRQASAPAASLAAGAPVEPSSMPGA